MGSTTKDADLFELPGTWLGSTNRSAGYSLEAVIGEGAHGVVFSAHCLADGVPSRVVVKVLRPHAVRELGALAGPAIAKEVAALRLLAERPTPTPNVVRFLDAGMLRIGESSLSLPWVALEYVDGGLEGVTLTARVQRAMTDTRCAFDVPRARSAVQCLAAGVGAIHEVGVIHRDLTPNNVLTCGSGATECFKISDFGLARVASVSTFGEVLLGTPGYCAPEQSFPEKVGVGPHTDVFGLACCTYFLLTGEPYFTARSIPETLMAVHLPTRKTLSSARALSPTLRTEPAKCATLDELLARATRSNPRERPQSAAEFGAGILGVLGG